MERKGRAAFGDITLDFDRQELRRFGQLIAATSLEFRLLRCFIENPERTLSREELIHRVWRTRKRMTSRTVDNAICQLRQKLEDHPSCPVYFRTMYGVGYKFVPSSGKEKFAAGAGN